MCHQQTDRELTSLCRDCCSVCSTEHLVSLITSQLYVAIHHLYYITTGINFLCRFTKLHIDQFNLIYLLNSSLGKIFPSGQQDGLCHWLTYQTLMLHKVIQDSLRGKKKVILTWRNLSFDCSARREKDIQIVRLWAQRALHIVYSLCKDAIWTQRKQHSWWTQNIPRKDPQI